MFISYAKRAWALTALLCVFALTPVWAVPPGFNIQGRLTDANGVNREGNYSIRFTLYDAATGGTALWVRTYTALTVRNGNFQTIIGDVVGQPMLSDVFALGDSRHLEIQVLSGPGVSSPEQPLIPRQQLVSVPYALRSDSASTLMSTGAVTITAGGLGRISVNASGNVGVGTNNPQAPLEVNGNAIAATPIANNHLATKGYVDAQVSAAGGSFDDFTAFSTPGQQTFTVPAGVTKILTEVWGGGGSGGVAGGIGSMGGGGGGYGKKLLIVTPGSNLTITVGQGGPLLFGGGDGGTSMVQDVANNILISATGGKVGGSGGSSDALFKVDGERGRRPNRIHSLDSSSSPAVEHGAGGGSYLNPHGGGEGARTVLVQDGSDGTSPGGGGGGGSSISGFNGPKPGAGAPGLVALWY